MSKEEVNRKLAEWLGFLKPDKDETEAALRDRCYELRHWTLHRHSGAPIENFSSYFWTAPDFYTDEAANAMLLEKMPSPLLWKNPNGEWTCDPDDEGGVISSDIGRTSDRKTAIVNAALALIEVVAR